MYLSIREAKAAGYDRTVQVNSTEAAKAYVQAALGLMVGVDQEFFWVVALNAQLNPTKPILISAGGQGSAPVDMRVMFRRLIDAQADSFICVHNHPSGYMGSSKADDQLTQAIYAASVLLGFDLKDHFIVTADGVYSMHDGE